MDEKIFLLNSYFLLFSQQIIITFNDQEVPRSPFLINVHETEAIPEIRIDHDDDDADEVDSPGNHTTSKSICSFCLK